MNSVRIILLFVFLTCTAREATAQGGIHRIDEYEVSISEDSSLKTDTFLKVSTVLDKKGRTVKIAEYGVLMEGNVPAGCVTLSLPKWIDHRALKHCSRYRYDSKGRISQVRTLNQQTQKYEDEIIYHWINDTLVKFRYRPWGTWHTEYWHYQNNHLLFKTDTAGKKLTTDGYGNLPGRDKLVIRQNPEKGGRTEKFFYSDSLHADDSLVYVFDGRDSILKKEFYSNGTISEATYCQYGPDQYSEKGIGGYGNEYSIDEYGPPGRILYRRYRSKYSGQVYSRATYYQYNRYGHLIAANEYDAARLISVTFYRYTYYPR